MISDSISNRTVEGKALSTKSKITCAIDLGATLHIIFTMTV